jgi:hypothetical protein
MPDRVNYCLARAVLIRWSESSDAPAEEVPSHRLTSNWQISAVVMCLIAAVPQEPEQELVGQTYRLN